jgi:2'-5' RNA ligase
MRLFTGISIADGTLRNLDKAMIALRPLAKVKWSPVENLHITTKFIGEWPELRLAELEQTLGGIQPVRPFEIKISAPDYYPNARKPRVLFARVTAGPELSRLAGAIDDALAAIGCAREDLPYSPHLTLARIRNENIHKLREQTTHMSNIEFGSFEVTEFHLYLSNTIPHGSARSSVYSKLRTYAIC